MIIAVDGVAAAGKGTLARALARQLEMAYLDTGLLYRGVAHEMLKRELSLADEHAAGQVAASLPADGVRDDPALRTREVGDAASAVSAFPKVRAALLAYQRDFAQQPAGAVLDGRDIGTVVLPNADVKFFVTASAAERARRRAKELGLADAAEITRLKAELIARDERDSARTAAPLTIPPDALVLDTTDMTPAEVLGTALAAVRKVDADA